MNLPSRFPGDAEVILEEVAGFRALPPDKRVQSICSLLKAGALIMRRSGTATLVRESAGGQEDRAHQAIKELVARHGRC